MFAVEVNYSLKGSEIVESPALNCLYMTFNSFEDVVETLEAEIIETYVKSKSYLNFKMSLPENKHELINYGTFECAYIFGPHVKYNIKIKKYIS